MSVDQVTMKTQMSSNSPCGSRSRIQDRKSTRLNSSHSQISYAVFCLKKKKNKSQIDRATQPRIHGRIRLGPATIPRVCVDPLQAYRRDAAYTGVSIHIPAPLSYNVS